MASRMAVLKRSNHWHRKPLWDDIIHTKPDKTTVFLHTCILLGSQSQNKVTAHTKSKQLLPFVFTQ